MMPFVTYQALRDALRGAIIDIRENVIPQFIARIAPRTTIASASTADSGRNALVDEVRSFTSGIDGQGTTQVGRAELAGHLVVPRNNEPAQVFGDLRNSSYMPLGSPKYRPSGAKAGDAAQYNLTDENTQRASVWTRETGKVEANSGTGAGQDVVVNGGTHKVARVNDRTKLVLRVLKTQVTASPPVDTLSFGYVAGSFFTVMFSFNIVGGLPFPAAYGVTEYEIDPPIVEGAEHFKA